MTFYKVQIVLGAFALTCAVTLALTIYTMQSKKDFSSWGAGYVALCTVSRVSLHIVMVAIILFTKISITAILIVRVPYSYILTTETTEGKKCVQDYITDIIHLFLKI